MQFELGHRSASLFISLRCCLPSRLRGFAIISTKQQKERARGGKCLSVSKPKTLWRKRCSLSRNQRLCFSLAIGLLTHLLTLSTPNSRIRYYSLKTKVTVSSNRSEKTPCHQTNRLNQKERDCEDIKNNKNREDT